ncbi:MAG: hypothetical protein WC371_05440, partial [Parachlamydiales bacterium]
RRRFLNLLLAQSDPLYVHHLSRFLAALKERSYLLKKGSQQNLEIYEAELSSAASYITLKRGRLIDQLKEPFEQILSQISPAQEKYQLRYVPSITFNPDPKIMQAEYQKNLERLRPKDLQFKTTQVGPHHDDFIFYLDQKIARNFASEGQKRTLASALRLAEYSHLSQRTGLNALLNIDDLGAHLDKNREKLLQNLLKNFKQVFITTPSVPESFQSEKEMAVLKIENGRLIS